jgi:excinuclease ABC subunit C
LPRSLQSIDLFDRKFGADFLAGVPAVPGVYHLYDGSGVLLYVGKARNLRRRLGQYRAARRIKAHRKRRDLVRAAARIEWQVCASELEALLTEIRDIQAFAPRKNVAGAFPFLYPFVGVRADGADVRFCLTTAPDAFASFDLYGAFRSRVLTREAFFALMRLLRFVGHAEPRRRVDRASTPRYSHVYTFRRLPGGSAETWAALLRGSSRQALTDLSLRLLEHPAARARSAEVGKDLRLVGRLFDEEAAPLAAAIVATGHIGYPVAQRDRDTLFLKFAAAAQDGRSAGAASSECASSASHFQVDERRSGPPTS